MFEKDISEKPGCTRRHSSFVRHPGGRLKRLSNTIGGEGKWRDCELDCSGSDFRLKQRDRESMAEDANPESA